MGVLIIVLGTILVGYSIYLKYYHFSADEVMDYDNKTEYNIEKNDTNTGYNNMKIDENKYGFEDHIEELFDGFQSTARQMSSENEEIKKEIEKIRQELEDFAPETEDENPAFEEILESTLQSSEDHPVRDEYRKIIEYYQEGLSPDVIAEKMNLGIRETGLVLKLYTEGGR